MSREPCQSGGRGKEDEEMISKWLAATKLVSTQDVSQREVEMEVVDAVRLPFKTELEDEDRDVFAGRQDVKFSSDPGFAMNAGAQGAAGLPQQLDGCAKGIHKCGGCSKVFLEVASVKMSDGEHSPNLLNSPNPTGSALRVHGDKEHLTKRLLQRVHVCPVSTCPWRFENEAHLSRHIELQHGPGFPNISFTCPFCGLRLSRPDQGKRHMRDVHQVTGVSVSSKNATRRSSRIKKSDIK